MARLPRSLRAALRRLGRCLNVSQRNCTCHRSAILKFFATTESKLTAPGPSSPGTVSKFANGFG